MILRVKYYPASKVISFPHDPKEYVYRLEEGKEMKHKYSALGRPLRKQKYDEYRNIVHPRTFK